MRVRSLGQEDLLEEGMTTHSNILAWRIPWTEEEPGRLQSIGLQRVRQNRSGSAHMHARRQSFKVTPNAPHPGFIPSCSVWAKVVILLC